MLIMSESKNTLVDTATRNIFIIQKVTKQEEGTYYFKVVWTHGNPNDWSITLGKRNSLEGAQQLLETIQGRLIAGSSRFQVLSEIKEQEIENNMAQDA